MKEGDSRVSRASRASRTNSAAGDSVLDESRPTPPPPPPPEKPPDVELVVDGFGIMPSQTKRRRSSSTSKTDKIISEALSVGVEASPAASSTNLDIVRRYTWKTKNRMTVQVISYGATITCIQAPCRKGIPDDVVAGFETLEEYLNPRNPYMGATLGRFANVIAEGTMVVRPSGRVYMLSTNKGDDHFNGGYKGFDKVNWQSYVSGNKVIMSHVSERFSEGYPGTVLAQISFEVSCDNTIKIEMRCTTSEPTIINMSQMPYFNLAGHHAGKEPMKDHIFTINADKYTNTDKDGMVTGEKKVVGGTIYDFRVPRVLRCMLPKVPKGGYDLNYCITQGTEQDLTFMARALHPHSGRVLEVYSNQPGMQFYTGNQLPDPDIILPSAEEEEEEGSEKEDSIAKQGNKKKQEMQGEGYGEEHDEWSAEEDESDEEESEGIPKFGYVPLYGKGGCTYDKHGLFCLMPQNYPDAVNRRNFPSPILNPGEVYVHKIQYKFGILLGKYV